VRYLSAVAFVGCVFAANWALERWGLVPVGFGLEAPAGVYFAGLAFLLRDTTQRLGGRAFVIAAILVGTGAAYFVAPRYAAASAVAFLVSELADYAVYTPLAERSWPLGVAASNVAGAFVDSVLFLTLAFGSLAFLSGQMVGKLWVTAAALPVVLLARRAV
jgi:queuosine precursor transporter